MNILITGANGFIGKALRGRLASGNKVIGVDITGPADGAFNIAWEQADLTDGDSVTPYPFQPKAVLGKINL